MQHVDFSRLFTVEFLVLLGVAEDRDVGDEVCNALDDGAVEHREAGLAHERVPTRGTRKKGVCPAREWRIL